MIVDQFEELFTQNPPEVQERFAELLGRLALEADAHVLLSLRDDFLLQCHDHEALEPVFSELTPIKAPAGSALRRALVQPALKSGYRFEDEALVDEMLAEVEGERGALPLLAFAAAQLWQRRDRERGLLTREAYEEIGGVAGALARHAESTLEQIGQERLPLVREHFRHLVTAQRTRATWDREELLSTFSEKDRDAAAQVLASLIDARLLTSYELQTDDDQPSRHRVEVIHESLLRTWPRLVRWQSQDEDGAHLLDQLRQTAQLWDERGRPDDLLWTGTSFKEYELWRERYPGGLSATEDAFAEAMIGLAKRRQRRLRLAVGAAFAVLLAVLGIVGGFWRQSVAEARRAEASKLLALGQLELDSDPRRSSPTTALAYALASLELSDQPATRRFVMESLWSGPLAFVVGPQFDLGVTGLSSDGNWIQGRNDQGNLTFHRRSDGSAVRVPQNADLMAMPDRGPQGPGAFLDHEAIPGRDLFLESYERRFEIYRHPPGSPRHTYELFETSGRTKAWDPERLLRLERHGDEVLVESWPIDGGSATELGRLAVDYFTFGGPEGDRFRRFDVQGDLLLTASGRTAWAHRLDRLAEGPVWSLEHESEVVGSPLSSQSGKRLSTHDQKEGLHVWSLLPEGPSYERFLPSGLSRSSWDPEGRKVAAYSAGRPYAELWDQEAPPDAGPAVLHRRDQNQFNWMEFDPTGEWIVGVGPASRLDSLERRLAAATPAAGTPGNRHVGGVLARRPVAGIGRSRAGAATVAPVFRSR